MKIKSFFKYHFFKYVNLCLASLLILAVFVTTAFYPSYQSKPFDIFSSRQIVDSIKNLELNMTSVIYVKNADGDWEEYRRLHGDENRIWISGDKIPKTLKNAFIAIEDERFEKHHGVDWKRTFLAVANQFLEFSSTEFGGSTITQQLIKNITSDRDKVYERKVREIVRALFIETQLEKHEILEAYLNTIALGNGICGVQVAANYYFNKEVSELSLVECAAIAAITKNPSRYNPVTNMEENKARRQLVIQKMFELGLIEQDEYSEAYNADIELDFSQKETLDTEINNYFVDTLIEQVIADLSEKYDCNENLASQMFYNGGFKIYSTMDYEIQGLLEETYQKEKRYFYETRRNDEGEREKVQSAMTIMDYNGHIVGIVGGTGEKTVNRGLNRAYSVPRQPGSTMKPIGVYALAIDKDIVDYTSSVLDRPIKNYYGRGKWGPREWFGGYMGNVPLNYALRKSMNAVPVRLLEEVGIDNSYEFLTEKLHCKYLVEADKNPSALALGGCNYGITPTESAAAFSIFGNGGVYHKPTTYYKIERANGEVVFEHDKKGEQVISEASATIMNHLLREVVYNSEGTGRTVSSFNYKMKAYAKTGTSSDTKDSWLVGGTPYYVGSVWYGYDHNQTVSNRNMAKTIWRDVMREIHKDLEKKEFEDSEDVYKKGIGYYKEGLEPKKVIYKDETSSKEESSKDKDTSSKESSSQATSSSDTTTSSESTSSEDTSTEETPPTDSSDSSGSSSEPPIEENPSTPTEIPPSSSDETV